LAETDAGWLRAARGGCLLHIHVQPGAARSGIAGLHGDALKVRVAAPPVEGAANAALVDFVAGWLELSRREVTIEKGDKSRRKTLWVATTPAEVERRLNKDRA
jgi:hypothetical protein